MQLITEKNLSCVFQYPAQMTLLWNLYCYLIKNDLFLLNASGAWFCYYFSSIIYIYTYAFPPSLAYKHFEDWIIFSTACVLYMIGNPVGIFETMSE